MIKLTIRESEYNKLYDNECTPHADRIAAWVYEDDDTMIDKLCDIEEIAGKDLSPKCTSGRNFLSATLQDQYGLETLERIERELMGYEE